MLQWTCERRFCLLASFFVSFKCFIEYFCFVVYRFFTKDVLHRWFLVQHLSQYEMPQSTRHRARLSSAKSFHLFKHPLSAIGRYFFFQLISGEHRCYQLWSIMGIQSLLTNRMDCFEGTFREVLSTVLFHIFPQVLKSLRSCILLWRRIYSALSLHLRSPQQWGKRKSDDVLFIHKATELFQENFKSSREFMGKIGKECLHGKRELSQKYRPYKFRETLFVLMTKLAETYRCTKVLCQKVYGIFRKFIFCAPATLWTV